MTSISQLSSNGYYQLSGQNKSTAGQTKLGSNIINQTLAEILGNQPADADSAYTLNLGADALNYLNLNTGASNAKAEFVLNKDQQATLDDIINKYKALPLNQENYEKLQNDLQKAGLSAHQLALQDKIKNFNPSQILIAALSGQDPAQANGMVTQEQSDQKSENYMNSILRKLETSQ
jgi:hypothetical protein